MDAQDIAADTGKRALVIALTGATGFLGGHVIDAALTAGHQVKALTRRPQPEWAGISWIPGDLQNDAALAELAQDADVLIHMAGVTKALNRRQFFYMNTIGTEQVLQAAAEAGVAKVIHVSSLAAREPHLSHYAASKAASEDLLVEEDLPFDWAILRPPAIYGPGDLEILKILKASRFGILPALGSRANRFSMIHGADLADYLIGLGTGPLGQKIIEVDDGADGGYTVAEVAQSLPGRENRRIRTLTIPKFLLIFIGAVNRD